MSIIDNTNNSVVAYTTGVTKAFTGQRLSTVNYRINTDKNSADFNIKKPSVCVSLPPISVTDIMANIALLTPAIIDFLQGTQDKMIRSLIDAGSKSIGNADININSIIEYLGDSNGGERLTKDSIGNWFDNGIADKLMLVLASKLGIDEDSEPTDKQSKQIELITTEYKNKFSALAGGKTSYEIALCESLKKALLLAGDDDILAVKFTAKLDKMIAESGKNSQLFDLL